MSLIRCQASRRLLCLLPVLPLILLCGSCSDFWVSNSSTATLIVSPPAVLLKAAVAPATTGDTFTLSATATTVGGTSSDVTSTATWTSSSPTNVAVASGVITAAATGGVAATITASSGGETGSCAVFTYTGTTPTAINVTYTLPTGVTASTIPLGTTFNVFAQASPSLNLVTNQDITSYVQWTLTSNTAGATISTTGQVTVPSTATIGSFTVNAIATFGSSVSPSTLTGSTTFTVI